MSDERYEDDTIVAAATPPGKGAVGIVRLSGERAFELAGRILKPARLPAPGRLARRVVLDPELQRPLDEAMVVRFVHPRSYTGEDVVEFHLHGNPLLLALVQRHLCLLGARLAFPGEFTLRAFLHGRKDLAQAESVADLVEARSSAAILAAASGLLGDVGRAMERLARHMLELLARLEAEIDFPEDVPEMPDETLGILLRDLVGELEALLASHDRAAVLKHGFRVVLTGPPNVGKSTLFNALLRRNRAIVSQEPGTTRDFLEEFLDMTRADPVLVGDPSTPLSSRGPVLDSEGQAPQARTRRERPPSGPVEGGPGGAPSPHGPSRHIPVPEVPVLLVDTAGLRETDGDAERKGVERTLWQLEQADLVLLLHEPGEAEDVQLPADKEGNVVPIKAPIWHVMTKSDRLPRADEAGRARPRNAPDNRTHGPDMPARPVSMAPIPRQGLDPLRLRSPVAQDNAIGEPGSDRTVVASTGPAPRRFAVSALCHEGLHALSSAIRAEARERAYGGPEDVMLAGVRQWQAVHEASLAVRECSAGLPGLPRDIAASLIRQALEHIHEVTGKNPIRESVLDFIFSHFCIGK